MDYDATNKTDLKGITAMVISHMKEFDNAINTLAYFCQGVVNVYNNVDMHHNKLT